MNSPYRIVPAPNDALRFATFVTLLAAMLESVVSLRICIAPYVPAGAAPLVTITDPAELNSSALFLDLAMSLLYQIIFIYFLLCLDKCVLILLRVFVLFILLNFSNSRSRYFSATILSA